MIPTKTLKSELSSNLSIPMFSHRMIRVLSMNSVIWMGLVGMSIRIGKDTKTGGLIDGEIDKCKVMGQRLL